MNRCLRCIVRAALVVLPLLTLLAAQQAPRLAPRPAYRIGSGSMVEALLGPHLALTCDDCGFPVRVAAAQPARPARIVCGNCGYANAPNAGALRGGTVVELQRLPGWSGNWRRWDLVIHDAGGRPAVKRLVRYPGESLRIRQGDLFVAGRRLQKSLDEFHAMALLVHDDRFRTRSDVPPRWRAAAAESGWQRLDDGFRWRSPPPQAGPRSDSDWLQYHHWNCMPDPFPPLPRTADVTIVDHYPYNQGLSRNQLHEVRDLALQLVLEAPKASAGSLSVRFRPPGREVVVQLATDGSQLQLALDGQPRFQRALTPWLPGPHLLELAYCDGRLLLAADDQLWLALPLEVGGAAARRPFALAADGAGQVRVKNLRVLRDVHYLGPRGESVWQLPADSRGYFLLGDNVPVSWDSRQNRTWAIGRNHLLGRALPRASGP